VRAGAVHLQVDEHREEPDERETQHRGEGRDGDVGEHRGWPRGSARVCGGARGGDALGNHLNPVAHLCNPGPY